MRFLGLGLADPVPDANTIWTIAGRPPSVARVSASRNRKPVLDQELSPLVRQAVTGLQD